MSSCILLLLLSNALNIRLRIRSTAIYIVYVLHCPGFVVPLVSSLQTAAAYGYIHILRLHQLLKTNHCVPAAFHHSSNQRLWLMLEVVAIWTCLAWFTEGTHLPCPFKCSWCHASLCAVCRSLRICPESAPVITVMGNFVLSFFWFLPLLFEGPCAPGNSIMSCDSGYFFLWFLWGWKGALQGRVTLPFPYYSSAERFATFSLCLITSLSFQLVTICDVSSWRIFAGNDKAYLV